MKTKIATALVTGALLAATVMPAAAFAGGRDSSRHSGNRNTVRVTQTNRSLVLTGVLSVAATGGNTVNGNTASTLRYREHDNNGGGDASITTGNARSTVDITIGGSSNTATVDPCGCATPTESLTSHGHSNSATVTSSTTVTQSNSSAIVTLVGSIAATGGNTVNGNTGGNSTIDTGNAHSTVDITVNGSTNTLNP